MSIGTDSDQVQRAATGARAALRDLACDVEVGCRTGEIQIRRPQPRARRPDSGLLLIVDDDDVNLGLLRIWLDTWGIEAETCDRLADAWLTLATGRFSRVLIDYMWGDSSAGSLTLAEYVRGLGLPFAFWTAWASEVPAGYAVIEKEDRAGLEKWLRETETEVRR